MARISYVNGRFAQHSEALVHIEDRGYQFADGVYEVMAFYNRRFLDEAGHMQRLERSLQELSIAMPMSMTALTLLTRELVARNARDNGTLYIQVTRGVARRDHGFPAQAKPALSMMVCPIKIPKKEEFAQGVAMVTHPDERWARCDIKSVSLLANVLAKQAANQKKAREALLVKPDGTVTEGSSCNFYIVNAKRELLTHPREHSILGGITRQDVIEVAEKQNVSIVERPFNLEEVMNAREAFITSTSINILPVVTIDERPIANGKPGPVTGALLAQYLDHVEAQTGFRP